MLGEKDPDLRAMARGGNRAAGAGTGADRRRAQDSAAAQGSQRRKERGARNPRRHRRRRGHPVRRRNLPHVRALRRIAELEDRSHLQQRIVGGRAEGSDRAGQRQQGLQQAEIRKRRAPRAARAGDRAAGPRSHLGHHRGGAAGSRRSRSQDRPQGHPHRHVLLLRPRRPVGEHHLFGRAPHPPAHRPGGLLPGREIADQEPRQGGARAALAALRNGAGKAAGGAGRGAAQHGGHGRPQREDPHLQLPAEPRHRSPHRPHPAPARFRDGRQAGPDHRSADHVLPVGKAAPAKGPGSAAAD